MLGDNVKYKIGKIIGNPTRESRFIICKAPRIKTLTWYSAESDVLEREDLKIGDFYNKQNFVEFNNHWKVAVCNDIPLSHVLGGGTCKIYDEFKTGKYALHIYGNCLNFGSVPIRVRERFGEILKEYFKGTEYKFKEVKIGGIDERYPLSENLRKWRELGFWVE